MNTLEIIEIWRQEHFGTSDGYRTDLRGFSHSVREIIKGYERFRKIALKLQENAKEKEIPGKVILLPEESKKKGSKDVRQKSRRQTRNTKGQFRKSKS